MPTQVVETIEAMREALEPVRRAGDSIGLVPTMGALHAGHRALIDRARAECHRVVVTLFVNPTQFDDEVDLARYPSSFERDLDVCRHTDVDWLFAPSSEEMYPAEPLTRVEVERLTTGLCGADRSGHFRGVTTVVAKLFHIVPADRAYFGEKDYQQLATIRRMVSDLNFPIEIVGVETVREPDGLALSSRNRLLTNDERQAAVVLHRALRAAQRVREGGELRARELVREAKQILESEPLAQVEYVELVDAATLSPIEGKLAGPARIALAVRFGATRLIDNAGL